MIRAALLVLVAGIAFGALWLASIAEPVQCVAPVKAAKRVTA